VDNIKFGGMMTLDDEAHPSSSLKTQGMYCIVETSWIFFNVFSSSIVHPKVEVLRTSFNLCKNIRDTKIYRLGV
jgi:hypothetical protein